MAWLAVLTLPDGDRAEARMSTVETATAGLGLSWYRLHRADGSIREFSTLTSILIHLGEHYDPDDLGWVTDRHESDQIFEHRGREPIIARRAFLSHQWRER